MGWFGNLFGGKNFNVVRRSDGSFAYWLNDSDSFSGYGQDLLKLSLSNIALFTAQDIKSTMFSRGRVCVVDTSKEDMPELPKDPFLKLIENPNFTDSQQDFLYKHEWFKGLGNNLTRVIKKRVNGSPNDIENVASLEHLIPSNIDYKKVNKVNKMIFSASDKKKLIEQEIDYKLGDKTYPIPISDIAFFYDIASGLTSDSKFKSNSRIKSVLLELANISEAQKSKNINLKFSSKHLTSHKPSAGDDPFKEVHLDDAEKKDIESILYQKDIHALGRPLEVHSLANDFRKLMFDNSIASDAMRVFSVLGIEKDVLNWWMNGQTTYDNKNQGIINWVQNSISYKGADFGNTWTSHFNYQDQNKKILVKYDHLPIMKEAEKASMKDDREAKKTTAETIKTLSDAGLDLATALAYVGVENLKEAKNEEE